MTTPTQWPDWTPDQPGDQAPPPPPAASGGGPGGPSDWGAPPEPSRGRGLLAVAIVASLLIGTGLLGVAGYFVSRDGAPIELAEPAPDDPAVDAPSEGAADEPLIDAEDFDDPTDAVTAELLETIDEAELTMIEFQIRSLDGVDADGMLLDGGEALVQDASQAGADALGQLEARLSAIEADGSGVTDGQLAIRDRYREHLVAWKDWMTAIQDDPTLLEQGNEAAAPFSQDIADTAEDFVTELRIGLPDGTPDQLRAFAEFILERGFGGPSAPGGELA